MSTLSIYCHFLLHTSKKSHIKKNRRNLYIRCLLFCLFLCASISACCFSRQHTHKNTNQPSQTSTSSGSAVANTDFGSTILSLLTPEHGSVPLTDEDVQEAFSYFCKQAFIREVSSDSLSLHYTLACPETYSIEISPSFGEAGSKHTEAVSAENYLYLLSQFPYDALTRQQKLTYQVFQESLQNSIRLADYELYAEPLSKTIGIQAQLPVLLSEYAFYREEDVDDYLTLLTHLPAYFEQLADFERQKAGNGLFMHEENAMAILNQCEEMVLLGKKKDRENFLITSFTERLNELSKEISFSKEQKTAWKKKHKQILKTSFYPAYEALGAVFKELLTTGKNTCGLSYFPEGTAYYEQLVRYYTGSDRSIAQLKKLINERILSCAAEISAALKDDDALSEAVSEADSYSLPFENREQILSYLKTQLSGAFPMASQISCRVLSVPDSLAEYLSPAFYLVPPIDLTTQNCIYINEPQIRDDLSFFTTLAHEGYPGHLYQNAMFEKTNPTPLRTLLSYPGYSEGWASYAELYSYRLSGLSESAAILQENNALLTLCMYAMADIHIHYDGYTEGGLKEYLNGFGITNEESIHAIYLQILAEPANYLKYTMGCLEFLSLKEDVQKAAGDSFDLLAFHEKILSAGPCSFRVLRNLFGL